jgi:hypothetical protein
MAAYSKTQIANQAISHIGIGKEIANVDTENSQEATACRRFFDIAREATLRDAPWPFAAKRATLALVEEDPNDEWGFKYRYPTDCLFFKRILSGDRNDTPDSRVAYKIEYEADGQVIYCDEEDAECEYTVDVSDTSRFPSDFVIALSLRLALYIAPRLTAGDPYGLRSQAAQMYRIEISRANASAFNEEQPDETPDAELIRERE